MKLFNSKIINIFCGLALVFGLDACGVGFVTPMHTGYAHKTVHFNTKSSEFVDKITHVAETMQYTSGDNNSENFLVFQKTPMGPKTVFLADIKMSKLVVRIAGDTARFTMSVSENMGADTQKEANTELNDFLAALKSSN